ncbi:superoxide dismutase family protein [Pseudotabrizicola algicola]|uniref:Superoxide dismutase [Cu-Zn] n=1 Tax=Pseudotabrizicola algicola TaxID=2709381 RepID=A0A6B3RP64_9RHOB|nr:superoxide dismutase family protein [Pseudotabrizicola algicola]NEX47907.1 superoxide dismutase family protein [Pseudotabrizicola algicola]
MPHTSFAATAIRCLAALGLAVLPSTVLAQDAQATFVDQSGNEIGAATLTATDGGVLLRVEINGLPPRSWVGFHVHEIGTCDPASQHESAGDHFNPSGVEHGFLTDTGPHAGDMPNLWVDDAGVARAEVFNPFILLAEGQNSVLGRALMIHADPDDHASQPSGDAGERLACAVIG